MKPRLLLNLALVIAIAILALLVWWQPGIKKPTPPVPLTTLQAADVNHIRIAQPGQTVAELVKDAGVWQLVAPVKLRADQYLVKNLLDSIHEPTQGGFAAQTAELGKYGLNPPGLQLWLNSSELDFGGTEPLNDYRYVKVGDRILLATGLLFFSANHAPLWWADKQLLPQDAHITAIQLPNATLTLVKGKWQLAPADSSISTDAIQALVDAWQNASAISVTALPAHASSQGEVAIALKGVAQPLRFAILKDPDFLVLARPDLGLEYQLDSGLRSQLLTLAPVTTDATKPSASNNSSAKNPRKDSAHARTAGSGNRAPRH